MDETKKKKILKIATFSENPDLAMFDEVQEMNDSLKTIADKKDMEMPEYPTEMKVKLEGIEVITLKGDSPTDDELRALITPLIPEPIPGKNYVLTERDKKDISQSIKVPVVEKIIEKTEVIREQPVITNEIKEVAVADTPVQVRDKLETLDGDERLDQSAIKNLKEDILRLEKLVKSRPAGGGRSGGGVKFFQLTPTGSSKVFSVPKGKEGALFSSDFPMVLMEGNGFTLNATRTQLTMTTDNNPTQGSQLLYIYSALFNTL